MMFGRNSELTGRRGLTAVVLPCWHGACYHSRFVWLA